jgi:diguanylate cyclase (GGDEF)-like protein
MDPRVATTRKSDRVTSLRSRWHRAFALLTAIVLLSGLASFIGARFVVDIFRNSAVRVEREATIGATLRAEIVAASILVASPVDTSWWPRVNAAQLAIKTGFAEAISNESTPAARKLLAQSLASWQAIVTTAGPLGQPSTLAVRGNEVTIEAPKVLTLLDQAGSISRDAVRAELADAARADRDAMAIQIVLELLAIALALRLGSRLSSEILRPVATLRASANQLAAGELNHRVVVDRVDELGDLAMSFNAMADAIAGTQRSLSLRANTDSLSGLANRAAFRTRLEATLARKNRRDSTQAVLFVDIDDFKDVNDTLGHAAGDELLRVVARRLTDAVRPGDLVARLGGDEFALLLDDLSDPGVAVTVAERVVTSLAAPAEIGGKWAHVGASVGLAMRGDHSTFEGIMREADIAMYAAKGNGKNRVERYNADLDNVAAAQRVLDADLHGAAGRGELVLDYQPVVHLETGALVGLEALVRWQHPVWGLLPPSGFISTAEDNGAIISIGSFVLGTAAEQLERWQRSFERPDLWMAVNVSVNELEHLGFADRVESVLDRTGLDPTSLVLEVTETILAAPAGGAAEALAAVRLTGVRVALDDFGTGYSSIGYLRQLPIDILKVDRSFVADACGPGDTLLEAIVALAKRLDLEVIPEGIEEFDQLSRLRAMGCSIGQGFLLARPMSVEAVGALLAERIPLPHIELGQATSGARHGAGDPLVSYM